MGLKKLIIVLLIIGLSGTCLALGNDERVKSTIQLDLIGVDSNVVEEINVAYNLEELTLSKKKVIRIEGLENLSKLREISLESFFIFNLEWLPEPIIKLNLSFNRLKDISGIENFSYLNEVILSDNQIISIDNIFKSNSIKKIELGGNMVEIVTCSGNESIQELDLSSNNIKQINNLHELRNLKVLYIYDNPIVEDDMAIKRLQEKNPDVSIIAK